MIITLDNIFTLSVYIVYLYILFQLCSTYYFRNILLREWTTEQYTFRLMRDCAVLYGCELMLDYTYQISYYGFIFFYLLWCYTCHNI